MYLFIIIFTMTGTIKVLKTGYGFITTEGQDDVFFHAKNLSGEFDDLEEGMTLSFEVGEGNNGKQQAINVEIVEAA